DREPAALAEKRPQAAEDVERLRHVLEDVGQRDGVVTTSRREGVNVALVDDRARHARRIRGGLGIELETLAVPSGAARDTEKTSGVRADVEERAAARDARAK